MSDWLLNLPVWAMALLILAMTYAAAAGIFVVVTALAKGERARAFKSVSGSLLSPLGTIFGLLAAFSVVQVWSDLDHALVAVNREASALRMTILLATSFPGESEAQIRDVLRRHIDEVVSTEWPLMAQQSASLRVTPATVAEALRVVLSLAPQGEGQIRVCYLKGCHNENFDSNGQRLTREFDRANLSAERLQIRPASGWGKGSRTNKARVTVTHL
ncbi:MAG: hypothetical protein JO308_19295 [Verrucomicrobia bacterium]|nr:hypothetical protein [Verrucomicrobiota bacterium]